MNKIPGLKAMQNVDSIMDGEFCPITQKKCVSECQWRQIVNPDKWGSVCAIGVIAERLTGILQIMGRMETKAVSGATPKATPKRRKKAKAQTQGTNESLFDDISFDFEDLEEIDFDKEFKGFTF